VYFIYLDYYIAAYANFKTKVAEINLATVNCSWAALWSLLHNL